MATFLKMDLHIHSSHSFDCSTPVKDIIAQAKRRKLDIIGITDHGTRDGALEAARTARKLQVLIGQEVKTKQGDVLVFNVSEDLPEGEDADRTCKRAHQMGGIVIIPHPFDPLRQGTGKHTEKLAKYAHAVEAFNPKCFFGWSNKKAEQFAEQTGITGIASSDAHRKEEVGRAYTQIQGKDPWEALEGGNVKLVTSPVKKKELVKRRVKKALKR